jgi:hypothetical protein
MAGPAKLSVWSKANRQKLQQILNHAVNNSSYAFRNGACSGASFEPVYLQEKQTYTSLPDLDDVEIAICAAWGELAGREFWDQATGAIDDTKLLTALNRQKSGPSG